MDACLRTQEKPTTLRTTLLWVRCFLCLPRNRLEPPSVLVSLKPRPALRHGPIGLLASRNRHRSRCGAGSARSRQHGPHASRVWWRHDLQCAVAPCLVALGWEKQYPGGFLEGYTVCQPLRLLWSLTLNVVLTTPPPSGCRRFALGVAPSVYKGGQRGHSPTRLTVTVPAEASSRVSPPSMVSHGRNVPSLCFLGVSQTAKCRMTTIDRWGSPSLQIKKSWLRAAPTVRVLVQEAGAELLEVSLLWDLGQYQNGCCSSGNHIQTTQNPGKMASVSSRISTFRTREVFPEAYSRSVTPQVSLSSHWKEPGVTTVGLEQPGFALPELQAKDTRLRTRRKKDLAMGR